MRQQQTFISTTSEEAADLSENASRFWPATHVTFVREHATRDPKRFTRYKKRSITFFPERKVPRRLETTRTFTVSSQSADASGERQIYVTSVGEHLTRDLKGPQGAEGPSPLWGVSCWQLRNGPGSQSTVHSEMSNFVAIGFSYMVGPANDQRQRWLEAHRTNPSRFSPTSNFTYRVFLNVSPRIQFYRVQDVGR